MTNKKNHTQSDVALFVMNKVTEIKVSRLNEDKTKTPLTSEYKFMPPIQLNQPKFSSS